MAINCSAIPDNLVESELFGHEKGAFTDAKNARIGLFEAADHGTLFLDEIASLSFEAQAKLLLALENKIIRRVGGTKEIKVDVRIIGAANQDLRKMIAEASFSLSSSCRNADATSSRRWTSTAAAAATY